MNNGDGNFTLEKVVVITGATKGLGKALALAFAKVGCDIVGIYHADAASAEAVKLEFKANNYRGIFIRQDITEEGKWDEFEEVIESKKNKHLTLIANACAPFTPKPFHLIDWLEVSSQIDVNVKGTFLTFKRLLPYMMKSRAGNVISVLTTALNLPPKGFATYVTTKSALEGLTKALAVEYASRGIRVFSVSPGFMETSLTAGWSEHLKASIYSNKENILEPSEIAKAILALTEDTNTRGNGENYLVQAQ
jgi:3-oxoacyl-[acyl-carrier protein] reductase